MDIKASTNKIGFNNNAEPYLFSNNFYYFHFTR